jgi:hypothetical protein
VAALPIHGIAVQQLLVARCSATVVWMWTAAHIYTNSNVVSGSQCPHIAHIIYIYIDLCVLLLAVSGYHYVFSKASVAAIQLSCHTIIAHGTHFTGHSCLY